MAFYLRLDGIPGEIDDPPYKRIEVLSWTFGQQSSRVAATAERDGTAATSLPEFNFTMKVNSSSPLLMRKSLDGTHIASGDLVARSDDRRQVLKFEMTDIIVSGFQVSGSGGSVAPVNQVSLNYATSNWSFGPPKSSSDLFDVGKAGLAAGG